LQVFPSPTASEGPTSDKWAQPSSPEKRVDAADSAGSHAGSASGARPGTRSGMFDKLTRSLHHVFCCPHTFTHFLLSRMKDLDFICGV